MCLVRRRTQKLWKTASWEAKDLTYKESARYSARASSPSVDNLAILYTNQGRIHEAEAMYQQALEGYEEAFEPEHTPTLNTVKSLGSLYGDQGRMQEAKAMYILASAKRQRKGVKIFLKTEKIKTEDGQGLLLYWRVKSKKS